MYWLYLTTCLCMAASSLAFRIYYPRRVQSSRPRSHGDYWYGPSLRGRANPWVDVRGRSGWDDAGQRTDWADDLYWKGHGRRGPRGNLGSHRQRQGRDYWHDDDGSYYLSSSRSIYDYKPRRRHGYPRDYTHTRRSPDYRRTSGPEYPHSYDDDAFSHSSIYKPKMAHKKSYSKKYNKQNTPYERSMYDDDNFLSVWDDYVNAYRYDTLPEHYGNTNKKSYYKKKHHRKTHGKLYGESPYRKQYEQAYLASDDGRRDYEARAEMFDSSYSEPEPEMYKKKGSYGKKSYSEPKPEMYDRDDSYNKKSYSEQKPEIYGEKDSYDKKSSYSEPEPEMYANKGSYDRKSSYSEPEMYAKKGSYDRKSYSEPEPEMYDKKDSYGKKSYSEPKPEMYDKKDPYGKKSYSEPKPEMYDRDDSYNKKSYSEPKPEMYNKKDSYGKKSMYEKNPEKKFSKQYDPKPEYRSPYPEIPSRDDDNTFLRSARGSDLSLVPWETDHLKYMEKAKKHYAKRKSYEPVYDPADNVLYVPMNEKSYSSYSKTGKWKKEMYKPKTDSIRTRPSAFTASPFSDDGPSSLPLRELKNPRLVQDRMDALLKPDSMLDIDTHRGMRNMAQDSFAASDLNSAVHNPLDYLGRDIGTNPLSALSGDDSSMFSPMDRRRPFTTSTRMDTLNPSPKDDTTKYTVKVKVDTKVKQHDPPHSLDLFSDPSISSSFDDVFSTSSLSRGESSPLFDVHRGTGPVPNPLTFRTDDGGVNPMMSPQGTFLDSSLFSPEINQRINKLMNSQGPLNIARGNVQNPVFGNRWRNELGSLDDGVASVPHPSMPRTDFGPQLSIPNPGAFLPGNMHNGFPQPSIPMAGQTNFRPDPSVIVPRKVF